jgi:hypothetical protein
VGVLKGGAFRGKPVKRRGLYGVMMKRVDIGMPVIVGDHEYDIGSLSHMTGLNF